MCCLFNALGLTAEAAAAEGLAVRTQQLDLGDSSVPLPPADLVIAADVLYDETLAAHVARRVHEAAARGSWVIVGDQDRGPRKTFVRTLRELYRPGASGSAPAMPWAFDEHRTVRLAEVGWKAKPVDLMHINRPRNVEG